LATKSKEINLKSDQNSSLIPRWIIFPHVKSTIVNNKDNK